MDSITKFWLENPSILYSQFSEIFPTKQMDTIAKLNSLTRLLIYTGAIAFLYTENEKFLAGAVIGILVILFVFKNSDISLEKFEEDCSSPSKDNPFMNVLISDYNNGSKKETSKEIACGASPEINKLIEENFNFNLYKDTDDLFNKNNSQRQFYTTANTTIPNDQETFANWLYKSPKTCKEDTIKCPTNIHEDLRQNHFIFPNENENPYSSKQAEQKQLN